MTAREIKTQPRPVLTDRQCERVAALLSSCRPSGGAK